MNAPATPHAQVVPAKVTTRGTSTTRVERVNVPLLDAQRKPGSGWLALWKRKGTKAEHQLPGSALILAPVLASYANTTTGENIRPANSTLTKATSLGRSTVIRACQVLEQAGWFTKTRQGGTRPGGTNQYRLSAPTHLVKQPDPLLQHAPTEQTG